jgi:hypothetical protein
MVQRFPSVIAALSVAEVLWIIVASDSSKCGYRQAPNGQDRFADSIRDRSLASRQRVTEDILLHLLSRALRSCDALFAYRSPFSVPQKQARALSSS